MDQGLILKLSEQCLVYQQNYRSIRIADEFYIHVSARCESISIIVQQDASIYSLLFPANCCTCFG